MVLKYNVHRGDVVKIYFRHKDMARRYHNDRRNYKCKY